MTETAEIELAEALLRALTSSTEHPEPLISEDGIDHVLIDGTFNFVKMARAILALQSSEGSVAVLASVLERSLEEDDPDGYIGQNVFGRVALDGSFDLAKVAKKVLAAGRLSAYA